MVKRRFVNPIQSNIQKKSLTEAEKQAHPLEQMFRARFHFDPLVILDNLKPQLERLQLGGNPDIESEIKDLLEEIEIIKAAHTRGESDFVAYKIFMLGARANGLNFFAPIKEFFRVVDDAERGERVLKGAQDGHEAVHGSAAEKQALWQKYWDNCIEVKLEPQHRGKNVTEIRHIVARWRREPKGEYTFSAQRTLWCEHTPSVQRTDSIIPKYLNT